MEMSMRNRLIYNLEPVSNGMCFPLLSEIIQILNIFKSLFRHIYLINWLYYLYLWLFLFVSHFCALALESALQINALLLKI